MATARLICGEDDFGCIFDYAATNRESFALASKAAKTEYLSLPDKAVVGSRTVVQNHIKLMSPKTTVFTNSDACPVKGHLPAQCMYLQFKKPLIRFVVLLTLQGLSEDVFFLQCMVTCGFLETPANGSQQGENYFAVPPSHSPVTMGTQTSWLHLQDMQRRWRVERFWGVMHTRCRWSMLDQRTGRVQQFEQPAHNMKLS